LYEAGNGPGLDAWGRGTPVVMSEIPSFREHLDTLGVKAKLFDPRSPADIALKISEVLDRPEEARKDAESSMASIRKKTWESAANAYYQVFLEAREKA
jgi:glycosyltransferase involved in cell wall biosynthesis